VFSNGTKEVKDESGVKRKVQLKIQLTFDKQGEALIWLEQQRQLRREGYNFTASRMVLADWLKLWLKSMKDRVSHGSHSQYESRSAWLVRELGDFELGQLSPLVIEQALGRMAESGASPSLRRNVLKVLRACLKDAVRFKKIPSNPATDARPPRVDKNEMHCWTLEDARKFLGSVANHKHHALFRLALDTGMRKGELLALRWGDVNVHEGWLDVKHTLEDVDGELRLKAPKTEKSRRRIWFGEDTRQALVALSEKQGVVRNGSPVFRGRDGSWMWVESINRSFPQAVKKAGVPHIRFHDLRHTCATLLLQAGASIKAVSARLGHTNVNITLATYAHVLPGEQKSVAKLADKRFGVSHVYPINTPDSTEVQVNKNGTYGCEYKSYFS
jgi:integrase